MRDDGALAVTIALVTGERKLDPRWVPLVEAFATEFGIDIVNVTTDDVSVHGSSGRLCLWARTSEDAHAFQDASGNYDPDKQARADELAPGGPWFVFCANYEAQAFDLFIERGARQNTLDQARILLGDERITTVRAAFGRVVVFVGTDEQRDSIDQEDKDAWESVLWGWFSSLNPAGLANRSRFRVEVDSEQTFTEKYQGSSYYYWL